MNKLIASAAALLALAAPGMAAAQTGYVGLSYSSNDDSEINTTALSGAVALGSSFQLDGTYANAEADGGGEADFWNLGGHLFNRSGNMLWGGYLGYSTLDFAGDSLDEWTIAGQMQYYADRTTFSGDLSYSQAEFLVDLDVWGLDGEIRHFATDNFSIQGNLGYFDASADGGASVDGLRYGIGAEWQLSGAPFSIYGGWQQIDVEDEDASSLGVGVRWNFGGTLFERNRSGAGLNRPVGFNESLLLGGATPR
ncbi:MAG: hypothetical protein K2P58_00280 [Hyphomonadaceae bacterium]|nr:hypothetical protein [Hyphomonadaceae bacterium]